MVMADDWIVLGFEPHKQHIAYKQITHLEDASFNNIHCDYPDIDKGYLSVSDE